MTHSEQICSELGKLYFFKELEKSDLVYLNSEDNQERELADTILRVGNNILTIQIKEMTDTSKDIEKWLNKKVYTVAKNQTKATCKAIFEDIKFKNNENSDILDNIEECNIIPLIIFDVKENEVEYEKIYETKDKTLLIHIFDLKDFKKLCQNLISPMEMVRYINKRTEFIKQPIFSITKEEQLIMFKTNSEQAMLDGYCIIYDLYNIDKIKLLKFNRYLTLFEEHCIKNKEHYKIMIKIMSQFYAQKISFFIERIDLIIEKGFKNEIYWDSYLIDNQQCVLFISLPRENYSLDFIRFISNIFMCNFKKNEVLVISNYAISNTDYGLDFSLIEYDRENENMFRRAIDEDGYADVWNNNILNINEKNK